MVHVQENQMQPRLLCTVRQDPWGVIGHLAIHNRIQGRACGGVRLVTDASLDEMRAAARIMAYKAGFIGFPMGGAKAVVQIDPERAAHRADLLLAFGRALAPLIQRGVYLPGTDMNSTAADIQLILQGAGLRRDLSIRPQRTHVYTAWSCFIATLAALEVRGLRPSEATFAVQGFGKVGSVYARLMSQTGGRLTAVSNLAGARIDPQGFDVDDLIDTSQRQGEDFIGRCPRGERVSHPEVLTAPVTVLLPAARAWAVHAGNQPHIQAPIIVCAANVAMTADVEQQLVKHGQTVVPDFVANCGGLLGSVLEHEVSQSVIWRILQTAYRQKIDRLLLQSEKTGQPISTLAGQQAEARMAAWRQGDRTWSERGRRWLGARMPRPLRTRRWTRFYRHLWVDEKAETT
jgi:glutamate dehydrogenase (NAD(P)+)